MKPSAPKRLGRLFDENPREHAGPYCDLSEWGYTPPETPEWIDETPMRRPQVPQTSSVAAAAAGAEPIVMHPEASCLSSARKGREMDESYEPDDAEPNGKRRAPIVEPELVSEPSGETKRQSPDLAVPGRKRRLLIIPELAKPEAPVVGNDLQAHDSDQYQEPYLESAQLAREMAEEESALLKAAAAINTLGGASTAVCGNDEILFQVSRYLIATNEDVPQSFKSRLGQLGQDSTPPCRLLGRTKDGRAVQLYVAGFRPYFYAHAPADLREADLEKLKDYLERTVRVRIRTLSIVCDKFDMMGYSPDPIRSVRVELFSPGEVAKLRDHWFGTNPPDRSDMSNPVDPRQGGFTWSGMKFQALVWEADVQFHQRLSLDIKGVHYCWMRLKAGGHTLDVGSLWMEHCDITALAHYEDLVVHEPVGEYADNAPFVTCSYDIECLGRQGIFPDPSVDQIGQIGCVTYSGVLGEQRDDAVCFTTGTGNKMPTDGSFRVEKFATERQMLLAFRSYVVRRRIDVLTGYNIVKFDNEYCITRAAKNGVAVQYGRMNRSPFKQIKLVANTFTSKAFGASDGKNTEADYECVDMLQWYQRNEKLESFTLKFVSAKELNNTKKDMHYSLIVGHHFGTDDQQLLLWEYNIWDADLARMLFFKRKVYVNMVETSRVTGVDFHTQMCNGQQVRVHSQILRMCRDSNFIVPTRPREKRPFGDEDGDGDALAKPALSTAEKRMARTLAVSHKKSVFNTPVAKVAAKVSKAAYEGATVIDPIKGFYDAPITTLDFSSLYPSIMIAHNLCYSAMVLSDLRYCNHGHNMKNGPEVLECGCVEQTPQGHRFVTARVREGILTRVLRNLLSARGVAKKDMAAAKAAKDPFMEAVQDGRQLALKVSANSVYGFTGATVGKLPCIPISAGVTSYGREMLFLVKNKIESTYQGKMATGNGLDQVEFSAKVIYGDTDSVMVRFGVDDVGQGLEAGRHASLYINAIFTALSMLVSERRAFVLEHLGPDYPHDIYHALSEHINTLCAVLMKGRFCAISIVLEKVLYPTVFAAKKRYCGGFYTKPSALPDKIHIAGFAVKRRDDCERVRRIGAKTIDDLMNLEMTPEQAFKNTFAAIQALADGDVDLDDLIITRAYSKDKDAYANGAGKKMPHIIVNERRRQQGVDVYHMGDRIPYIMVRTEAAESKIKQKQVKTSDIVEDIDYAREKKLTPDYAYYVGRTRKLHEQIYDLIFGEGFTKKNLFDKIRIRARPVENTIWNSFKNTTDASGAAVPVPRTLRPAGPKAVPRGAATTQIDMDKAKADFHKPRQSTLVSFFAPQSSGTKRSADAVEQKDGGSCVAAKKK